MNKFEKTIVALLFLLLIGWGFFSRQFMAPPAPPAETAPAVTNASPESALVPTASPVAPDAIPALTPVAPVVGSAAVAVAPAAGLATPVASAPEQTLVLSNELASITVSSHSGGIVEAELFAYRAGLDAASGPMTLDFSDMPALAYSGVAGLQPGWDFEISATSNGISVRRDLPNGLVFERTIRMGEHYAVKVSDTFRNPGVQPIALSAHGVRLGTMRLESTQASGSGGYSYLGLDTLADASGEGVHYWMNSGFFTKSPLLELFNKDKSSGAAAPSAVAYRANTPMAWIAVKNKFFAQILEADKASLDGELFASRDVTKAKGLTVDSVSAALVFGEKVIEPGDSMTHEFDYYAGPKKYSILKLRAKRQTEIMEFGRWFGWICKLLLPTLNGLYAVTRNYGIAIILLTALVRVIFWPVTHKSTESMKKMQKLQPLVAELRAKYKDNAQKLNQETMALYREHKVNPVSGCLPMLVQIPVFFALFTVLRSAIELRYTGFLWISDLSEPEGILASVLPFGGINILPLVMTAATIWQQKLTPSTGDPQQQKMMMFMPVVMLFIFYNMASALVLYWTTSTVLSVVQLVMQRRKGDQEPVAPAPATSAPARGRKR